MEFTFDCEQVLNCDRDGFSIIEGSFQSSVKPGFILYVNEILDKMGFESARQQRLQTLETSAHKFFVSNNKIFILARANTVIGYIKIGFKRMNLRDKNHQYYELSPLCILDFYVYGPLQRSGYGKVNF